jgi:hypothetical protein
MAFNMKRPIIKGTPLHKALTESIVAQTRTQTDGTLVSGGEALGRSYIPIAIDYSVDGLIDFGDVGGGKKKKKKKKKGDKYKSDDKTTTTTTEVTVEDLKKNEEKKDVKKVEKNKTYVDVEDEDNDYSGVASSNSNPTEGSTGTAIQPYENWEVGENKKNIAAAESNKKRLDKATKERLDKATKKRSYDASKKLVEADIANEENDYSAIENDNSDPTEGSTGTQNKPYENWKVREDKRNIAEAKALKAKMDAKNNTNFDYNSNTNSDIVAPETPKQKPKSKVKVDPSISAAETKAKEEFDNRDRTAMSPIEPKAVVELPNNTPDPKPKKADTTPNAKEKPDADKNPEYAINGPKLNAEGNPVDFGGSTNSPGYNYDAESDQWSYNGINITEGEVSSEAYTAITRDIMHREQQETQERIKEEEINLNSNTPSRGSSNVDLLPQPPPAVNNEVATTTPRTRKQKANDRIYNDFRTSKYTKNKMIKEGYNPIKSKGKSPMEMRDDRIYRNAQVDGTSKKKT